MINYILANDIETIICEDNILKKTYDYPLIVINNYCLNNYFCLNNYYQLIKNEFKKIHLIPIHIDSENILIPLYNHLNNNIWVNYKVIDKIIKRLDDTLIILLNDIKITTVKSISYFEYQIKFIKRISKIIHKLQRGLI